MNCKHCIDICSAFVVLCGRITGADLLTDDSDDGHTGGLLLFPTALLLPTGRLDEDGRPT